MQHLQHDFQVLTLMFFSYLANKINVERDNHALFIGWQNKQTYKIGCLEENTNSL